MPPRRRPARRAHFSPMKKRGASVSWQVNRPTCWSRIIRPLARRAPPIHSPTKRRAAQRKRARQRPAQSAVARGFFGWSGWPCSCLFCSMRSRRSRCRWACPRSSHQEQWGACWGRRLPPCRAGPASPKPTPPSATCPPKATCCFTGPTTRPRRASWTTWRCPCCATCSRAGPGLVVVSPLPQGPAAARRLIDQAQQATLLASPLAAAPRPALELGYLPGGAATLPLVARDLNSLLINGETAEEIAPALVILLAAETEPVQRWLEQVQPYRTQVGGVSAPGIAAPIVAVTSAAVDPVARAYWQSGQLTGARRRLYGRGGLPQPVAKQR